MARIRSVKPELRRDLTVADWPRETRYAWVLLWGYLDDEGRGLDDLRLLASDLFPLDRDVTERKLDGWLKKMTDPSPHTDTPPLCRYEVDGRRFLHAPKWDRSQRVSHPQPSRIPACPIHESVANDSRAPTLIRRNGSGAAPEPFRPSHAGEGLGVKGSRGQGIKGSRDQGVGVRVSGSRGAARAVVDGELVPADQATNGAHTPPDLEHLLADTGPWVPKIRNQIAAQVAELLDVGVDPDLIRRGLRTLKRRKGAPGLLAFLVQDELTPAAAADPRFAGLLADAEAHGVRL